MSNKQRIVILAVVAFVVLILSIPEKPEAHNLAMRFKPPDREHWFGTDEFGRDLFLRVLQGLRSSVILSLQGVLYSLLLGSALACLLVFVNFLSGLFNTLISIMLTIPALLLALALSAGFGKAKLLTTMLVVLSPVFARIVRDELRTILQEEYILASRLFAASIPWILLRHVLPGFLPKLLVQSVSFMAIVISLEASLSFLGLGIAPPGVSLGTLLQDSRRYIHTAPWLTIFPGLALFLFLLFINAATEGLRASRANGE